MLHMFEVLSVERMGQKIQAQDHIPGSTSVILMFDKPLWNLCCNLRPISFSMRNVGSKMQTVLHSRSQLPCYSIHSPQLQEFLSSGGTPIVLEYLCYVFLSNYISGMRGNFIGDLLFSVGLVFLSNWNLEAGNLCQIDKILLCSRDWEV